MMFFSKYEPIEKLVHQPDNPESLTDKDVLEGLYEIYGMKEAEPREMKKFPLRARVEDDNPPKEDFGFEKVYRRSRRITGGLGPRTVRPLSGSPETSKFSAPGFAAIAASLFVVAASAVTRAIAGSSS
jgi:hypothetical protein